MYIIRCDRLMNLILAHLSQPVVLPFFHKVFEVGWCPEQVEEAGTVDPEHLSVKVEDVDPFNPQITPNQNIQSMIRIERPRSNDILVGVRRGVTHILRGQIARHLFQILDAGFFATGILPQLV